MDWWSSLGAKLSDHELDPSDALGPAVGAGSWDDTIWQRRKAARSWAFCSKFKVASGNNSAKTWSSPSKSVATKPKDSDVQPSWIRLLLWDSFQPQPHIPQNAYHHTKNAYQKWTSNYYLEYKCLSAMGLGCDHHYCQPVSTCFSSAIFTQPDTTEGISVELG